MCGVWPFWDRFPQHSNSGVDNYRAPAVLEVSGAPSEVQDRAEWLNEKGSLTHNSLIIESAGALRAVLET